MSECASLFDVAGQVMEEALAQRAGKRAVKEALSVLVAHPAPARQMEALKQVGRKVAACLAPCYGLVHLCTRFGW